MPPKSASPPVAGSSDTLPPLRQHRSNFNLFVAGILALAVFAVLSVLSFPSVSSISRASKVEAHWLHPSHPSHRSTYFPAASSNNSRPVPPSRSPLSYSGPFIHPPSANISALPAPLPNKCRYAAVVNIPYTVPAVLSQLQNISGLCVIAVPIVLTPASTRAYLNSSTNATLIYLDLPKARALPYATSELLPNLPNAPSTDVVLTNLAYLLAIHQGASLVFEVWYDVLLDDPQSFSRYLNSLSSSRFPLAARSHFLFNPHPFFRPVSAISTHHQPHSWPRGFPIRQVPFSPSRIANLSSKSVPFDDVAILSSLLNIQPDVDASLATTTDQLPLSFHNRHASIALPTSRFTPLSSAFLIISPAAYPTLFLPSRAPVRIIDILRGYLAQRALHAAGKHVAFAPPFAYRPSGSVVSWAGGDVEYDVRVADVYDELVAFLSNWRDDALLPMAAIVQALWIDMYQNSVIEKEDISDAVAWLNDLRTILPDHPAFTKLLNTSQTLGVDRDYVSRRGAAMRMEDSRREPNVAVCIGGDLGEMKSANVSDRDSIPSTFGRVLLPKFGRPDVFVMGERLANSGNESASSVASVCEVVNNSFYGVRSCTSVGDSQTGMLEEVARGWEDMTKSESHDVKDSVHFLRQMHDCGVMLGQQAEQNGLDYDWVVLARGDLRAMEMEEMEHLTVAEEKPTIWMADANACCCGEGIRLAVGAKRVMQSVLQALPYIAARRERVRTVKDLGSVLKEIVGSRGIVIVPHSGIKMCSRE